MSYEKAMRKLLVNQSQPKDFILFSKKVDSAIADLELWLNCLKLKITEEELINSLTMVMQLKY
ncbi:hypothetical protein [Aliikangiella sp. IMCC44359]|uniref:hypothetical protein n=1 Tax=Aliikangiella sp. IMCC44359 TaxID=3459125 RepID=UPI00403AF96E